jgi:antitoxin FitA
MAQLIVRKVEEALVRKLKMRARKRGVSAEEEHRRILRESLLRPGKEKPSLAEYLLSGEDTALPDVELEISRSRRIETRDTGL